MNKEDINIIRYKKDLRVADHKPLYDACQQNLPLIALYIREPSVMGYEDYSHFHQYRIQESLKDLKRSLDKINVTLLMIHSEAPEALDLVRQYYNINNIYSHEETGNNLTYMRDININSYCIKNQISFCEYPYNGVVRRLKSRDIRSQIHKNRVSEDLIPIPYISSKIDINHDLINVSKKSFLNFIPAHKPNKRTRNSELPGEQAGVDRMNYFLSNAKSYKYALSRPEQSIYDSSRLSGYLTYGNLSIRQVYQATISKMQLLKDKANQNDSKLSQNNISQQILSLTAFCSRLFWRCHFIQKLESQPSIEFDNQNTCFDSIRSEANKQIINDRYNGQTGIPIIDAGMRCLHQTGWINFRMRATLVSFICNTCMQPRQSIGHMLAKLFLDYEPGIHYSQLQMQSGTTGINAIRIYNPIKQLQDKDSDLIFVRKRISEINTLSNEEIYILGTELGNNLLEYKGLNYPKSKINIIQSNKNSRDIIWGVKKTNESKMESKNIYQKLGSRKKPTKLIPKKTTKILIKKEKTLFDI